MHNQERSRRRDRVGVVISNKMAKTVTVHVTRKMRHATYGKIYERSKKFYAHDETGAIQVGQKVRIGESRPFSKLKRWRVIEVL